MKVLLIAFFLFFLGAFNAQANCPVGSYPWVDNWGNAICKSFDTGQTKSIQGSTTNCPVGSYPWTDKWGNKICKAHNSNQQYYDTSKSCPIGFHPWVDNWGNPICKKN